MNRHMTSHMPPHLAPHIPPSDASPEPPHAAPRAALGAAFAAVRAETERRAAPLSAEEQVIQSMPDASPVKWHRAHTTWFFEQFVLAEYAPGYVPFDPRFGFLFNSYYVAAGPRHERPKRGLITRPSVAEVGDYRAHVDAAMRRLIAEADAALFAALAPVVAIGLNHEQQHQELMLTDILHALAQNPLLPAYDPDWTMPGTRRASGMGEMRAMPEGLHRIGHAGAGFAYDNEGPAHRVLLPATRIAPALVTNADWMAFMEAGGYQDPLLWLSEGWAAVEAGGWEAPLYWRWQDGRGQDGRGQGGRGQDGGWHAFGLAGLKPVDPQAPVCHVSYYEADAFARFAGRALPTEQAFEVAAHQGLLDDAFGVVWQWTRSAYAAYPGYRAEPGALGEYNGKFMVNQMVLRGAALATPDGHARLTYRNFFHPHQRWQFTGLRLADETA
ncbi:ergothioneine biosynthesis protein EgtB [Azorhizobium doebereinerae]|uniref:ergothioneine biosynthesis protein EgtB n=1 Tax=Azorhizobium doebereinerae TaxID=281091 RepID=UPI000426EA97|nr:ergothioneine biosynthesis protein EgtB [Azorhizobium doebereinerae]